MPECEPSGASQWPFPLDTRNGPPQVMLEYIRTALRQQLAGTPFPAPLLFEHLDRLVDIYWRYERPQAAAFLDHVECELCPICKFQHLDGGCPLRDPQACSIRRYFVPLFRALAAGREAEIPR